MLCYSNGTDNNIILIYCYYIINIIIYSSDSNGNIIRDNIWLGDKGVGCKDV